MANSVTIKETKVKVGDTIRVHYKFREGETEKTQPFKGILIAVRGRHPNKSFIVRKLAKGNIGVERIFPTESPAIKEVVVEKKGKTRRSKTYFVRGLSARALKEKLA